MAAQNVHWEFKRRIQSAVTTRGEALLLFIVEVLENEGCKQHLAARESECRELKQAERLWERWRASGARGNQLGQ